MNSGILLVEYTELRHRVGVVHRLAAVLEATLFWVRPILVTSFTTVVGMLPLALKPAEGPQLMRPLAVAVIGGLTLSTALTFSVAPVFYLVLALCGLLGQNVDSGDSFGQSGAKTCRAERCWASLHCHGLVMNVFKLA